MNKKKSRKKENLIIFLFIFILAIIFASIDIYVANIEREKEIENAKDGIKSFGDKIVEVANRNTSDINSIAMAIEESNNIDIFDIFTENKKNDLNHLAYVTLVKDDIIQKIHPKEKKELIGKNINVDNLKLIFTDADKYDKDIIKYYLDSDNNVVMIAKYPVYLKKDGMRQYYGEIAIVSNQHDLTEKFISGTELENIQFPWRQSIKVGNGKEYNIYSHNLDKMKKEIEFDNGRRYIYHVDSRMMTIDSTLINILIVIEAGFLVLVFAVLKLVIAVIKKYILERYENDSKLDFFTNMIYEVRTSANAMISYCSSLITHKEVPEKIVDVVDEIHDEVAKLIHQSTNMLDLVNAKHGKISGLDEYYPYMLIDELKAKYKNKVDDMQIAWTSDISELLPIKFKGPSVAIKKSMEHIINYSLKNIIDGHIKVSAFGSYVSGNSNKVALKYVITDTGMGVKEEILNNIFKKDTKHNEDEYGEGAELYIANEIIKSVKGNLSIATDYDKGTVYTITLNQEVVDSRVLNEELKQKLEEKYRRNLGRLKSVSGNILVVDDNDVNLRVMEDILRSFGANVDAVKSGEVAIALASEKIYDMCFMDYLMTGLNGVDTIKAIKNNDAIYQDIPFILVTANVLDYDFLERYPEITSFIIKPISKEAVEDSLKRYMKVELLDCQKKED